MKLVSKASKRILKRADTGSRASSSRVPISAASSHELELPTPLVAPDDPYWKIYDQFVDDFRRQDREAVDNAEN